MENSQNLVMAPSSDDVIMGDVTLHTDVSLSTPPLVLAASSEKPPDDQDWEEAAKSPMFHVRCSKTTGELYKTRFASGSKGKCIRAKDQWFTPTEFEALCGRSASRDWKRTIKLQNQPLQTLIENDYLHVHAVACSCSICIDNSEGAGPIRLSKPYKRKKRRYVNAEISPAVNKTFRQCLESDTFTEVVPQGSTSMPLPVTSLDQLTMPGLVLDNSTRKLALPSSQSGETSTPQGASFNGVPLDKAWEHMNEILLGIERSVANARLSLENLKARCHQESTQQQNKVIDEKVDFSNVKHGNSNSFATIRSVSDDSEFFLVENDNSTTPARSPSTPPPPLQATIIDPLTLAQDGARKKCFNCNRDSLLECSGCRSKVYCSEFCQKKDWANHHSHCIRTPAADGYILFIQHCDQPS